MHGRSGFSLGLRRSKLHRLSEEAPGMPPVERRSVMAPEVNPPPVLPYAPPRPKPSRPALLAEVGCVSSMVGAIVFGVALPWATARGFVYDGAPSLMGGAVDVLFAIALGGALGALVVPAIVLGVYWIIWRMTVRP